MADWNVNLPGSKAVGDETHVEDHNTLVEAITEARAALDAVEVALAAKAASDHKHAAADVTSGTFDAARIPTLAIGKISGLTAALDGKADDGDLSAKADASALAELAARVDTLEASQPEG